MTQPQGGQILKGEVSSVLFTLFNFCYSLAVLYGPNILIDLKRKASKSTVNFKMASFLFLGGPLLELTYSVVMVLSQSSV